MYNILNKVNGPDDVKKLNIDELNELASDIRDGLFNRLTKIGGHFGPNFGIVEATIALHLMMLILVKIQVILIQMKVNMICLM